MLEGEGRWPAIDDALHKINDRKIRLEERKMDVFTVQESNV